jgi:hypothetical protein
MRLGFEADVKAVNRVTAMPDRLDGAMRGVAPSHW